MNIYGFGGFRGTSNSEYGRFTHLANNRLNFNNQYYQSYSNSGDNNQMWSYQQPQSNYDVTNGTPGFTVQVGHDAAANALGGNNMSQYQYHQNDSNNNYYQPASYSNDAHRQQQNNVTTVNYNGLKVKQIEPVTGNENRRDPNVHYVTASYEPVDFKQSGDHITNQSHEKQENAAVAGSQNDAKNTDGQNDVEKVTAQANVKTAPNNVKSMPNQNNARKMTSQSNAKIVANKQETRKPEPQQMVAPTPKIKKMLKRVTTAYQNQVPAHVQNGPPAAAMGDCNYYNNAKGGAQLVPRYMDKAREPPKYRLCGKCTKCKTLKANNPGVEPQMKYFPSGSSSIQRSVHSMHNMGNDAKNFRALRYK